MARPRTGRTGRLALLVGASVLGLGAWALASASLGHSPTPAAEAAPPPPPIPPAASARPPAPGAAPVVVELFTSEGCSSCPPADAVIAELERTQPIADAHVIVLAHHVDYWDSLGWPDPWSSPAATARQRTYASLHAGAYTPQAVIDGRSEVVGSRSSALATLVADAAKSSHLSVEISLTRPSEATVDVSVKTAPLPADAEVVIALVQDRGRALVRAGENAGRTLDHVSIVRAMVSGASAHLTLPPAVSAPGGSTFSVVALAQERSSRRILGSSARRAP